MTPPWEPPIRCLALAAAAGAGGWALATGLPGAPPTTPELLLGPWLLPPALLLLAALPLGLTGSGDWTARYGEQLPRLAALGALLGLAGLAGQLSPMPDPRALADAILFLLSTGLLACGLVAALTTVRAARGHAPFVTPALLGLLGAPMLAGLLAVLITLIPLA